MGQEENGRNYEVLQRKIMPAHKNDLQKVATSDPHDEMAPQKICEILDGDWALKRDCGDGTKRTQN